MSHKCYYCKHEIDRGALIERVSPTVCRVVCSSCYNDKQGQTKLF